MRPISTLLIWLTFILVVKVNVPMASSQVLANMVIVATGLSAEERVCCLP
jgi:hypothetical protein